MVSRRYASLTLSKANERKKEESDYKPIMIRLFLWQLFRDAHIHNSVQLVHVDSFLWANPESCLDTEHYPFEPIYFYQFLQYLMGCAWLIFLKAIEGDPHLKLIFPSRIFKNFLETKFFGKIDALTGTVLGENLNLMPIKEMYNLYASIAEPMSVKTFLNATYRSEKEELPCYAAISSGSVPNVIDGFNIVPIGHEVVYVQIPDPIIEERTLGKVKIENTDIYAKSLLTFRTLGKKKLIECLLAICPNILTEKQFDMNYNLTFLEFYEVIIKCAFLKAEDMVRDYESKGIRSVNSMERQGMTESSTRMRDKLKRKKLKKSNIFLLNN